MDPGAGDGEALGRANGSAEGEGVGERYGVEDDGTPEALRIPVKGFGNVDDGYALIVFVTK
jgi:hypothetical protein